MTPLTVTKQKPEKITKMEILTAITLSSFYDFLRFLIRRR